MHKWLHWLFPVKGWKERFREYSAGRTVWEVPGHPEADKVCPFPVEWIPHSMETSHPRGFDFLEATCVDTFAPLPIGVGVLCARCGVPLHPKAAHMMSAHAVPKCKRCRIFFTFTL